MWRKLSEVASTMTADRVVGAQAGSMMLEEAMKTAKVEDIPGIVAKALVRRCGPAGATRVADLIGREVHMVTRG